MMVREVMEGSRAVARVVANCDVKVIAAYPITPQTHIVQELAKMHADGLIDCEYINVEAEFSAISAILGATVAGARSFTATCSQGLALMHEVVFAAAGMRVPLVMVIANRALSAPINIWNDHQDSIAERDSGWIQIYCQDVQEVVDTVVQAYRIAEDKNVLLPVMVCMDGFYLTHVYEPVEIPPKEKVKKFLGKFTYPYKLDPKKPLTMGPLAFPSDYARLRKELAGVVRESKKVIKKVHDSYAKQFGRRYGDGLLEIYGKGSVALVAMGSVCGTIKDMIDKRQDGDVCLVRVRTFRPFPKEELANVLEDKEMVVVLDRDVSLGNAGALYLEVRDALYDRKTRPKIVNFIMGLGGVDVSKDQLHYVIDKAKKVKSGHVEIIDGSEVASSY